MKLVSCDMMELGCVFLKLWQLLPGGRIPDSYATGFAYVARFDNLQGDPTADRLFLFSHEHNAAAAFAELLQQFVAANAIPRFLSGSDFGPPLAD
jgi:hypothetical protein